MRHQFVFVETIENEIPERTGNSVWQLAFSKGIDFHFLFVPKMSKSFSCQNDTQIQFVFLFLVFFFSIGIVLFGLLRILLAKSSDCAATLRSFNNILALLISKSLPFKSFGFSRWSLFFAEEHENRYKMENQIPKCVFLSASAVRLSPGSIVILYSIDRPKICNLCQNTFAADN